MAGATALAAKTGKHIANNKKCQELGWAHMALGVKRQSRHSHDWHLVWLLTHNQGLKVSLTSMHACGQ